MQLAFGVKDFLHNLLIYHYIFYALLFVFAFLMLLLGIYLRRKTTIALFFYIGSFLALFCAPFVGSYYIEEYLRSSSLQSIKVTRLVYSKTIVVTANLVNMGVAPIKETNLLFLLVKKDKNSILERLNTFKPVVTNKIKLKEPLKPNENREIRVVLDITKVATPSLYTLYYQIKSF